jgi:hypothetical protein
MSADVRSGALLIALCALLTGSSCISAVYRGSPSTNPKGTISGTVRGPNNGTPASNRSVSAIDTTTGKRYSTRLNDVGDYTLFLPPGRYRIEVPLGPGEAIAGLPDPISLGGAAMKVGVDLVLTRTESAQLQ